MIGEGTQGRWLGSQISSEENGIHGYSVFVAGSGIKSANAPSGT